MAEPKVIRFIENQYFGYPIFQCDECEKEMSDYCEHSGRFICADCAFRDGYITGKEYLDCYGIHVDTARAEIYDGEIFVVLSGKFPWEMSNKDYRQSKEYKEWRMAVFERDGFKCQICGQVGGELNAHHIKHFKDYPAERFNVDNGITLCSKCHKELHRKERENAKQDH